MTQDRTLKAPSARAKAKASHVRRARAPRRAAVSPSASAEIFVQIAAYRDPELLPTLRDCIARAAYPERLRFGICWQRDQDESLGELERDPRLRIISMPYSQSPGVCWARNRVQSLYLGEAYTLQLDSHHRFVDAWDELLIQMLEQTGSAKPLLTAYAPAYQPGNEDARLHVPWKMAFDRFIPEGAVFFLPQAIDEHASLDRPLPARFYSAHFAFAHGRFCQEVMHDPNYYFHGEEISIAVRAFTHGYDLFHPHKVVVWHEYTRQYRTKHWDDHAVENKVPKPWTVRNEESHRRNRILFGMEEGDVDFGPFGFGRERTVADYERYAGLNFKLRLAQDYTLRNLPPPNPEVYTSDQEWIDHCVRDYCVLVSVPREALGEVRDYDFWFVGVHDRHGQELYRRDLEPWRIDALLAQPTPELLFPYRAHQRAASWTVWPHSRSRGWLEKVTRSL